MTDPEISTYLGGNDEDSEFVRIAVDASGNAYVTGHTFSTDFPTTVGAFQTTYAGGFSDEGFVSKIADVILVTPADQYADVDSGAADQHADVDSGATDQHADVDPGAADQYADVDPGAADQHADDYAHGDDYADARRFGNLFCQERRDCQPRDRLLYEP